MPSAIMTEVATAPTNLKFKITTRGIRTDSQKVSIKNDQQIKVNGIGNKHRILAQDPVKPPCKRKAEAPLDGQRGKRPKMDRVLKIQCGALLKELMSHRGAYIFAEPVDPVKLKIPDYFYYVSEPMDLGTIKQKLEGNAYFNADEFAHDVKLTFSNATTYNPVGHTVHELAKEMNSFFCRRWRLLEAKLKQTKNDDEKGDFVRHVEKTVREAKQAAVSSQKETQSTGLVRVVGEVKPARVALKACSSLGTAVQKEPCSQSACPRVDRKKSVGVSRAKCPSCASLACHCRQKKGSAQASMSGLSSERSSENNHCGVSKHECEVKHPLESNRSSSQETDGPGIVIQKEKSPNFPSPAEGSLTGWSSLNGQLSPSKALRAAMLKSRFAETIFKATHQSAEKLDPSRMREESERLEKEKQQEKARIEAEIKAAEAASRLKEQNNLKMKRERERALAKKALQEMERSVELYESLDIVNDVEMLFKATWLFDSLGIANDLEKGTKKKPLELLGLYLKVDKLQECEDFEGAIKNSEGETEEGEILS